MASFKSGNASPVYAMRDSFDLPTRINEGKALGYQGVRTDIIQKLALTSMRAEDGLAATRQKSLDRATAKDKAGLDALRPSAAPKKEAAVAPKMETAPLKFENAYRDTSGFAAVA